MRSVIAALLATGLCACGSDPSGVRVTLKFASSLTDATLASITSLVIHATGNEQADYPIGLGRKLDRTERLLYDPDPSSVEIALAADAFDASANHVAGSDIFEVTVKHGASVTLVLGPLSDLGDLGGHDLASIDLAGVDLNGVDLSSASHDMASHDMASHDMATTDNDMAKKAVDLGRIGKPDAGAEGTGDLSPN